MAQTAAQKARRKAQRKVAEQLKRNESPLGGEFREYVERAIERQQTRPPPVEPPRDYGGPGIDYPIDEESIIADQFSRGIGTGDGADQEIPLTYFPTATSYPSRLPQNKHPRTRAAGYNRTTQTLAVQFWTPVNLYYYYNVPSWMAREFRLADSPGDYINDVLNHHDYEKIY